MKLSDVVSALRLPIFAELPLIVFFVVFVLVCLHVMRNSRRYDEVRALPLDDDYERIDSRGPS